MSPPITWAARCGSATPIRRAAPQLAIHVVPDSGTGELVGLTGTLNIIIDAGRHSYDFEYTLEPAP